MDSHCGIGLISHARAHVNVRQGLGYIIVKSRLEDAEPIKAMLMISTASSFLMARLSGRRGERQRMPLLSMQSMQVQLKANACLMHSR